MCSAASDLTERYTHPLHNEEITTVEYLRSARDTEYNNISYKFQKTHLTSFPTIVKFNSQKIKDEKRKKSKENNKRQITQS